jgi:hypothetical protein
MIWSKIKASKIYIAKLGYEVRAVENEEGEKK